jgi:hypothetical protein
LLKKKGLAGDGARLTEKGQILKSASAIAIVTAISRICGYLRDQRIALLLGMLPFADSFVPVSQSQHPKVCLVIGVATKRHDPEEAAGNVQV